MAQTIEDMGEVEPLTGQEVDAFWRERRSSNVCIRCSSMEWALAEGFMPLPFSPRTVVEDGIIAAVPVYPMICRNCGDVRLIATETIDQWRAKRAKDE